MKLTENLNVVDVLPLIPPIKLRKLLPLSDTASETVTNARKAIQKILTCKDKRLLVIVGPCSIHDPDAAQRRTCRGHRARGRAAAQDGRHGHRLPPDRRDVRLRGVRQVLARDGTSDVVIKPAFFNQRYKEGARDL